VAFDVDTIRTRLREVAFLNSSATIMYQIHGAPSGNGNGNGNGAAGEVETFHFSGGIAEFVAYNNRARTPMHDPIYVSRMVRFVRFCALKAVSSKAASSGSSAAQHLWHTLHLQTGS